MNVQYGGMRIFVVLHGYTERTGKMDNKTMIQMFEWYLPDDKLHWRRCAARAKGLKNMGITTVWLPPAYKGTGGIHDVGYGVYDTYDLGEFDQRGAVPTKYGTKQEYIDGIQSFHENGIEVLADIVLNHKLAADTPERVMAIQNDTHDRNVQKAKPREITAWTGFTFPGRAGKYSDFTWSWKDFDGTDWDEDYKYSGIFKFIGKSWEENTDDENGNYDFLMGADLDLDSPRVIEELKRWGKWYLDMAHMDGFRLDAVKHMRFTFYTEWLEHLRNASGRPLFAVGEYWNAELDKLKNYQDVSGHCMSLFDVPFHYRLKQASEGAGGFDMRLVFHDTLVAADPEHAVTFVDNHDTQPGQALASWVQDWFRPLAYALVLLRADGYPCVFYGDLYGIGHDRIHPLACLPRMIKARSLYAYGEQRDYFDHFDLAGWTRSGDEEHPDSGMAVILSDGPGGEKNMYIGEKFAGMEFYDCMQNYAGAVTIQSDGCGVFPVSGGSVSVWVCDKAYDYLTVDFVPFA